MSLISPSNLNNKIDGSFNGSTFYQSINFIKKSKKNDIIIFSSVMFKTDDENNKDLYNLFLEKVKIGVILVLYIPLFWCNGNIPEGCNGLVDDPFHLNPNNEKLLKTLLNYSNCIPLYTTNAFNIHLKSCDWVSTDPNIPNAAVYFGSSNMYSSYHEEVGMYISGDYTKDNLILQAVINRSLIISDFAYRNNISIPQKNMDSYNFVNNFFNTLGNKYIKPDKKLINNIYYPIQNVNYQLDSNETVYCTNQGWTIEKITKNIIPISQTNIPNKLIPIKGNFRIGITPQTKLWWNTFAWELDLILYLINNAKKYIKLSLMEFYLDDLYWKNSKLQDPISIKIFNAIQDAIKRGIHILAITNIGLNWQAGGSYHLTYKNLMNNLSGDGTFQIRYFNNTYSQIHNKMYISDNDIILSSQHPNNIFMNIYGSSIMFDDITIRNYYDNYFNALWSISNIKLSDGTIQTPYYNTYPIIDSTDVDGTNISDNWFERKGNLLLCSNNIAPFSSCCGGFPTNNLKNKVLYEVVFSDPNLLDPLDGKHNNLFFGWWYNQIKNCPDNSWLYIVSAPVSALGSPDHFSYVGSGKGIGDSGNGIKALADKKLNQMFFDIYQDALKRGITIYIAGWWFPPNKYNPNPSDMIDDFVNSMTSNGTIYTNQIIRYNTPIFWHQKIFATPNSVYIGSQNALLPDSYEAGFAFYSNVGSNNINPLYFEVLKIAQQFVRIEAGYKPLEYNINNQLDAEWVNNITKASENCKSFLAVSPGNQSNNSMSDNKFVTTLFGDNVTTETEIMMNIAKNATKFLLVTCYDMGYTVTYPQNSKVQKFKGPMGAVIDAADRGVNVSIILTKQGILARLKDLDNYGIFIQEIINHKNINFYLQDYSCTPIKTKDYFLTRQCHNVHAKMYLNESQLYNSSSNFNPSYLETSVRNSGVYTNNKLVLEQFIDFFNWIKSKKECIRQINTKDDLINCIDQNPITLDTNKISVFNQYPNKYLCNNSYQCILDKDGIYSTIKECEDKCIKPPGPKPPGPKPPGPKPPGPKPPGPKPPGPTTSSNKLFLYIITGFILITIILIAIKLFKK